MKDKNLIEGIIRNVLREMIQRNKISEGINFDNPQQRAEYLKWK